MRGKCKLWPLAVLAGVAAILLVFVVCVSLAGVALWFERLSVFFLIVDDFFVRFFASIILLLAAIGIVWEEYRRIFCGDPLKSQQNTPVTSNAEAPKDDKGGEGKSKKDKGLWDWLSGRNFSLFKFAVLAAFSGGAFVFANQLDQNDNMANLASPSKANLNSPSKAYQFLKDTETVRGGGTLRPVVLARWVQVVPSENGGYIGGEGSSVACPYDFLVRAVLPVAEKNCPKVSVAYDDGPRTVSMVNRHNPYQAGFSEIQVCEARVNGANRPLSVTLPNETPIPLTVRWVDQGGPQTVSIIGDTGCRASNKQVCNDAEWPFAAVVADLAPARALATADLVVHVGDFMYVKFDAWDTWKAEFFDPAMPLLKGAPWLMVRGNHERCGKFGDAPLGYYLFFDIGSTKGLNCADDGELTATYAVDISSDQRVIVSDSATAWAVWAKKRNDNLGTGMKEELKEKEIQQDSDALDDVKKMLRQVANLAAGAGSRDVWFTTHVPVFSVGACTEKNPLECYSDPASAVMRQAWYELADQSPKVDTILAGHLHLFQVAEVTGQPLQIISGAGGVNIDDDLSIPRSRWQCVDQASLQNLKKTVKVPTNAESQSKQLAVDVCSSMNFGYVMATKEGKVFRFAFKPLNLGKDLLGSD